MWGDLCDTWQFKQNNSLHLRAGIGAWSQILENNK